MWEVFRQKLLDWYHQHKRELPWRKTRNPYFIWLSEIILQQTRIEQGLPYFYRFVNRFPDIQTLANASGDEVMKLWQGLGYYSRARNAHFTAKLITEKYNGSFPSDYQAIRKLKGIGDYTASLIASVCFNQPFAVVDGNVFRVISRLLIEGEPINTAKGKKIFQKHADYLLDKTNPGDFNQAMMELGALICTPKNPDCQSCPFSEYCQAFQQSEVTAYPKKLPKEALKHRYLNFIYIRSEDKILIEKRVDNDIWKGLYQLPLIEKKSKEPLTKEDLISLKECNIEKFGLHSEVIHLLTHRKLFIRFYTAKATSLKTFHDKLFWIDLNKLSDYPFPKPLESFLRIIKKN